MLKQIALSRYTPSMLSHETLEAIFVRRNDLVESLVEQVRVSVISQSKHYSLLIGPRGIGKTHTVSLLYHRVKQDAEIADQLVLAWLREEEYGVASYLDLLRSILRAIYEDYDDRALEEQNHGLLKKTYQEAEQEAERLLLGWIGTRTLLVIAENLDEIFRGLEDAGQKKLRALIQNHPVFTIVATSQSLFNGISLRESPFYGFFDIHHLSDFTFQDAVSLLTNIARHAGDEQLARRLQEVKGRARLRALHHLAGGNPRIYIIFSQFLTCDALDELVDPIMKTMDDLTPYYQARMSYLTPQQRKIVEFLCERRGAVPVSEIATSSFITHQTASGQLKRLRELGYVRSHELGRDALYEMREPLMRIALEVKRLRGEPIRLIIDFLRLWYSRREIVCRLETLSPDAKAEREYLSLALEGADTEADDSAIRGCINDYNNFMQRGDHHGALEVTDELIEIRGYASDFLKRRAALVKLDRKDEAEDVVQRAIETQPQSMTAWKDRGQTMFELGQYEQAIIACNVALQNNQDDVALWITHGVSMNRLHRSEDALRSFEEALKHDPKNVRALRNKGFALKKLGRPDEALITFDRALELRPDKQSILWYGRGIVLESAGRYEEALASFDNALACTPEDSDLWYWRGYCLVRINRYEEALASFDKGIEHNRVDPDLWLYRGIALFELARYEEALAPLDRALELDPGDMHAWLNRGTVFACLHEYQQALASYGKALELSPDNAITWYYQGMAFRCLYEDQQALRSYDHAIALAPSDSDSWGGRAVALYYLGRLEDSLASLEKSLELEPGDASILSNRAIALSSLGRNEESLDSFNKALTIDASVADFHLMSNRAVVMMLLGRWDEGAAEFEKALAYLRQESSCEPYVAIVHNLLIRTQDESTWRKHIPFWMDVFARYELLTALGAGLVGSIPVLAIPWISSSTASAWYRVWRELSEGHKEMDLPLRLLEAAVEYRKSPDERILLRLPTEERSILEPMIEDLRGKNAGEDKEGAGTGRGRRVP